MTTIHGTGFRPVISLGASLIHILVVVAVVVVAWVWWNSTSAPGDQGGRTRAAWLEDHGAAVSAATAAGERPILINFTGSDWCGWCVKLRDEVFDTGVFTQWAKDHVVLLECDFPRNKQTSAEVRQQNERLAEQYGIRGFPTIVVITAQGDEIARIGYQRGGAERWIRDLSTALERGGRQ